MLNGIWKGWLAAWTGWLGINPSACSFLLHASILLIIYSTSGVVRYFSIKDGSILISLKYFAVVGS